MQLSVYKYILLGLLVLISLTSIFNRPGIGNFELFNNYQIKERISSSSQNSRYIFLKYPPGTYLFLDLILDNFTLDPHLKLFNKQLVWVVFKVSLYFFYLFTLLTLLYLVQSIKKRTNVSLLDTSIAYFSSISILLASVGLSYFDIYAAPFFILSIVFIVKKQFTRSAIFYLLALVFNWVLLVFSPLFVLYVLKNTKNGLVEKIVQAVYFLAVPSYVLVAYYLMIDIRTQFYFLLESKMFIRPDLRLWISLSLFIFLYLKFLKIFFITKIFSNTVFFRALLGIFLSYVLLMPDISAGRLFWIPLLCLILFLVERSNLTKLGLILANVIVFMNLFTLFGTSGILQIRGIYFSYFRYVFLLCLVFFSFWYMSMLYNINTKNLGLQARWFLIVVMVLINLALIPADGSADHVSWTQYAIAATTYLNPFRAYTDVVLQYPPLSIVVISFFANIWRNIVGVSQDYTIAIKLSIFSFYLLSVGCLLRFSASLTEIYKISIMAKLVTILTTFSLIIQTQGLADINVYVIPSLFTSIFFLFQRKYWITGILIGLTISIKWQPAILLPLFIVTLLDSKEGIKGNLKRLFVFVSGFLIFPVISWSLVLVQPGGYFATARAFEFFATNNLLLSGQALNINWVATYVLHITDPVYYGSIQQLDYLNRQIPTYSAPWALRGHLFLITAFAIIVYYWHFQKKEITTFLGAAIMLFFSHHQLNKSAYEKHIFYVVVLMLFLYLIRPTQSNKRLLILFDIMVIMNLVFFYGTVGTGAVDRLFFGFDITIIFSIYYFMIYLLVTWNYFKGRLFSASKVG